MSPRSVHAFVLVVFIAAGLLVGMSGRQHPIPNAAAEHDPVRLARFAEPTPTATPHALPDEAPSVPAQERAPTELPSLVSGSWRCVASTYGYDYEGIAYSAASRDIPKGGHARVTAPNGRSVMVVINDWGPARGFRPDRCIDLSATSFRALGYPLGLIDDVVVERVD